MTNYCIVITSVWTKRSLLYPIVYNSEKEANEAIPKLPYSNKYNTFKTKELI